MASTGRMPAPARRAQLLDTARMLFIEHGYRTTTAEVAEKAGVSQALVVKHFGTKEELFRAAVADPLIELFEHTLREEHALSGDDVGTPVEHVERMVRFGTVWTGLVREHREAMLTLLREAVQFPDAVARLVELLDRFVAQVAEFLQRYADSDVYRDYDPMMVVPATLGALTAGALFTPDADDFVEKYMDMILRGLLSPDGRARLEADS